MTEREIPEDVRRFVAAAIPSVPFLEALLLLRSDAPTPWDAARLARRLYVSDAEASGLLQALCEAGVAAPAGDAGQFRFEPRTEELATVIERLERTYLENLVGVTDLIHTRVDKRAHRFADAFRWRKGSTK